ncbi:hypothetical protein ACP3TC_04590 [Winslowiella sp. 2C04]|uniref:hypothetical protein n=1 Tax=Winslowiella sp. 2C04 TaxID=3416179 RepID=UPI003CF63644
MLNPSMTNLTQRLRQGLTPPLPQTPATLPDARLRLNSAMSQAGESWRDAPAVCAALRDMLTLSDDFRQQLETATGLAFSATLPERPQKMEDLLDRAGFIHDDALNKLSAALLGLKRASLSAPARSPAFAPAPILSDAVKEAALGILLESGLKLTGMSRDHAQAVLPLIKLVRNALAVVSEKETTLADRLKSITFKLNTAQASLKQASPDSAACRWVNALCDTVDVLSQGLSVGALKDSLSKLQTIRELGLSNICATLTPLLEQAEMFQQWKEGKLTNDALAVRMLESVAPQQVTLMLNVARKLNTAAAEGGALSALGRELPPMPGKASAGASLRWMMEAVQSPALREKLEANDGQWLRTGLKLDDNEATFVQEGLLRHAQALADFPFKGTPAAQLSALARMPGLAGLFGMMNVSLNDTVPLLGPLMKDGLHLSDLGGMANASGTWEQARELAGLMDGKKVGYATGEALLGSSLAVLKKCGGALYDIAQAASLPAKKAYGFYKSEHAPGSTTSVNTFYRSLIHYIQDDYKSHPADYTFDTLSTLSAIVSGTLKCASGVSALIGKNTAELLEEYARTDPATFSRLEHTLIHAVLDTRLAVEIRDALQSGDYVQARKLLEPLGRALENSAGDRLFLRRMASLVTFLPALCDIHQAVRDSNTPQRELSGRLQQRQTIMLKHPELLSTLPPLTMLQRDLARLQQQSGIRVTPSDQLLADGEVLRAAVARLPAGEQRSRLQNELETLEPGLAALKAQGEASGLLPTQTRLHDAVRQTLAEEGVPAQNMALAQVENMKKMLSQVPDTLALPSLTSFSSLSSLPALAMDVIALLQASKKPGLEAAVAKLETLLTNAASDAIHDGVHWVAGKTAQLFTKEVELTAEEKAQGWFVMERELSVGQLATGAAAGAASGALLSAMFLLLSREGEPGIKGTAGDRPVTLNRTVTTTDGESGAQIVRLSPSRAGVYGPTTQPVAQAGGEWKRWLALALPVVAGAAAGAGVAAAVNPAIREKRDEHDVPQGMNTALTGPGRLHRVLGEDGVTKGIILAEGANPAQEDAGLQQSNSRVKRSNFVTHTMKVRETKIQKIAAEEKLHEQARIAGQVRIDNIRNSWSEAYLEGKVTTWLQGVQEGAVIRMGAEFAPEQFIRKFIQDIIDKHPEAAKRDELTSPDSVIIMREGKAPGKGSTPVTLIDLAMGKFNYLAKWPEWRGEKQAFYTSAETVAFRTALLNDASPYMSRGGYNLPGGAGRALPDRVQSAFIDQLDSIKSDGTKREKMAKFYSLSFYKTAKALAVDPGLAVFKPQLEQYLKGEIKPHQLTFHDECLTEVVALRAGNNVLAWDAAGTMLPFIETEQGMGKKNVQDWILKHLSANTQYTCRDPDKRAQNFNFRNISEGWSHLGPLEYGSPLSLEKIENIGQDTVANLLKRAEQDIKSTISTRSEFFLDGLIDGLFIGAGIVLSSVVPGSGIALLLKQVALAAGLTLKKDLVKLAFADSREQAEGIISTIPANLLASLLVDGSITLGLPLAKKILAKGNIKVPWAKELNTVKDTMVGVPGYNLANDVGSNIGKFINKDNAGSTNTRTQLSVHIWGQPDKNGHKGDLYFCESTKGYFTLKKDGDYGYFPTSKTDNEWWHFTDHSALPFHIWGQPDKNGHKGDLYFCETTKMYFTLKKDGNYDYFPTSKTDNEWWQFISQPAQPIHIWGQPDKNGHKGDLYFCDTIKGYFTLKKDGDYGYFPTSKTDNEWWHFTEHSGPPFHTWGQPDKNGNKGDLYYCETTKMYFTLKKDGDYGYFPTSKTDNEWWNFIGYATDNNIKNR